MPDREKAIDCLTDIENIMIARQDICPREELQYWIELQEGVADALALLKEQDAVVRCRSCQFDENGCPHERRITNCADWLKRDDDIVRCRDCKRFDDGICEMYGFRHEDDYYCADGVKRDD